MKVRKVVLLTPESKEEDRLLSECCHKLEIPLPWYPARTFHTYTVDADEYSKIINDTGEIK